MLKKLAFATIILSGLLVFSTVPTEGTEAEAIYEFENGMVRDQGNTSDTRNFPIQTGGNDTPPCKGGWGDFSTVFIKCYLNSNGKMNHPSRIPEKAWF